MRISVAILMAVGCSKGDGPDPGGDPTDEVPGGDPVSCAVQPTNSLRFDCAVEADAPGPFRIRLLEGGAEVATFGSEGEGTSHRISLWGMTPETTYAYEAWSDADPDAVISGEITTGALPEEADVVMQTEGTLPSDAGYVMFDWGCGTGVDPEALIVARISDGQIVWYQLADPFPGNTTMEGYAFTEDGTILALLERDQLVEWSLAGERLLDLSVEGGGLAHHVHHAVERRNGLTYVLTAEGVDYPDGHRYAMDGFDVIDGQSGVVASWTSEDVFDPTLAGPNPGTYWGQILGPDASDWAHGNAVGLSDDGFAYVSLRFINAIVKVAADPAEPAFGAVDWVLLGEASNTPYASDFALTSSTGVSPVNFGDQHHVTVDSAGDLMLWDNRPSGTSPTRALRIAVDPGAGVADVVEEWSAGQWCPGRGSAFPLPSGNVLADCSPENTVLEIERGTSEILWSMSPTCSNGRAPSFRLRRAVPVELYPKG